MTYFLDVESLSTHQEAVLLSVGIIYIDDPKNWDDLVKNSLFIKLDAQYQIETLKRKIDKSTIDWWMKQDKEVRNKSFKPYSDDLLPKEAFNKMRQFIYDHTGTQKALCYTRGSMDERIIEDLALQTENVVPFTYNQYRDVRTAIDILYPKSNNGYVEVDEDLCYNYKRDKVFKHDPVSDCQLDAAMLLYGKR